MSDPIVDILRSKLLFSEVLYADEIAKQIRQQIGRELLNDAYMINKQREVVEAWYIREVCQLEE